MIETMIFDEKKAADSVAYFCLKTEGKKINVLKVIKLIYIADRESIKQLGHPIQSDKYVAMPHGPVNSMLLNFINGAYEDISDVWNAIISERIHYDVGLKRKDIQEKDLKSLSRADKKIMDLVWDRFKDMDQFQIRDWTHNKENIPEWTDPEGGALNINIESIYKSVGVENYQELLRDFRSLQENRKIFQKA